MCIRDSDSTIQKMKCPYCDSEFEMETLQAMDEQLKEGKSDSMEWETKAGGEWQEGETDGLSTYVCQSCGGEIVGDATMAATKCPFCDKMCIRDSKCAAEGQKVAVRQNKPKTRDRRNKESNHGCCG